MSVSASVPRQGRSSEKFSSHYFLLVACSRRIAPSHARRHDIKLIMSMGDEKRKKKREKVIVVGAGPVGSLAALYAANRGNDVEVYELRGGELRK
jgi:threonine dehydrogenase-like Zn-dependent dehydrogenase